MFPPQPISRAANAPALSAQATASLLTLPAVPSGAAMDAKFIERNQIVERYIAGRLPARGAQDFERFCRENPELLDSIGLADRVNAGLRLLDASGHPEPWAQRPRKMWEKLPFIASVGTATLVFLIATLVLAARVSDRGDRIASLQKRIVAQPLDPATQTRPIVLIPSRTGPSERPAITVGGKSVEFVDFKIDTSWSAYSAFRVTIDRLDQGRVSVLYNLHKDSNGHLRVGLNSSALGPGSYQFMLEGLNWRGEPVPQAWITVAIAR
ncbi:MAG: hypothetical protein ABIT36_12460 [Steroidobacteraceae bacterium]